MEITKYCPWCDFHSTSLSEVLDHKKDEHPFLEGVRPPEDDRFTITPPDGGFGLT